MMEPESRPARSASWVALGAGLAAALLALLFFWSFDEPFALRGDNKLVHFPMKLDAYRQWASGHVPMWSSGLWLGFGLLGDATTGVFYLPHAPAFLLTPAPHLRAFDVAVAMHVGLLVAGTVALLRRLGCGASACAFGALAVPLASQVLGWTAYLPGFSALAWWPWALWAGDRLVDEDAGVRHVLIASIPIGIQVWAGYPETGLYSGVLVAAWVVFARGSARWKARLTRVTGLAGASVLMAGPQLVPSAYALRETIRASALESRGLLTLQGSWIDVVDPTAAESALAVLDPFLGAATLMLCAAAIVLRARRSWVLAGAALLAGLAALGDETPVYRVLSHVPVFELFRGPHKYFLVTQLCSLWLAALGLDALLARPASRRWVPIAAIVLAGAAIAEHATSFASHLPRVTSGHTRLEVETSDAMNMLDRVASKIENDAQEKAAGGPHNRVDIGFWLLGLGSFPMTAGLETRRGGGVALLPASHPWLHGGALRPSHLAALGVDYQLRRGPCADVTGAATAIDDPLFCLQEITEALPRYSLLARVRRAANFESMIRRLQLRPLAPDVPVLAPAEVPLPDEHGAPGSVRVNRYRPGRVELAVDTPVDRMLLVRESWSPGWEARVDGRPVPIQRAAGPFFAARVPAGEHRVLLEFSQPGTTTGWLLAAVWLALWPLDRFRRSASRPAR